MVRLGAGGTVKLGMQGLRAVRLWMGELGTLRWEKGRGFGA